MKKRTKTPLAGKTQRLGQRDPLQNSFSNASKYVFLFKTKT
jgi:hypothetical protein